MQNVKTFLSQLTTRPGVYQMLDEKGDVIYVGKAGNLKNRLSSYFSKSQKDIKTQALLKHVVDINVTVTHSEIDALLLECNLIKKYKPHYNILFRDDKSYPYIVISRDHPYPSVDFYRGEKKPGNHYFGPYPNVHAVRETIHMIQKLFGLRLSNDRYHRNRTRPCLKYQLGLCSGACAGIISPEDYQVDVQHAILFLQGKNEQVLQDLNQKMELAASELKYEAAARLRDQLSQLRDIQTKQHVDAASGDSDVIGYANMGLVCIQLLIIRGGRILGSKAYLPNVPEDVTKEEVITSFITQHYLGRAQHADVLPKEIVLDIVLPEKSLLINTLSEEAKRKITLSDNVRGERKKWLETANASAKQTVASRLLAKSHLHQRFSALKEMLNVDILDRIECFDVSHTMGEATMASCVVFNKEGPVKNDYRRFNIKGITPGDDVAAMHQALTRRYQRLQSENAKFPDLLLIDGGPTQLAAAQKTMQELAIHSILLVGVAKGEGRKPGLETLHIPGRGAVHLAPDSFALHLIQQVRDEAHRFAITGHRQQRDKKRLTSSLEEIPGIGAKRRRELLRYFGGIQSIKRASLEEIARVPGISQSLAERIFAALHNTVV